MLKKHNTGFHPYNFLKFSQFYKIRFGSWNKLLKESTGKCTLLYFVDF